MIVGTPPCARRGGALFAVEGNRWLVTLIGMLSDHPPTDVAGYRAFARSLPTSDIHALIVDREPVSEIRAYRFDASRRRHYEALARVPEGYLVLGDAMCSFNPVYGQGMSVALSQAKALDDCLARGGRGLAVRFFARAAKIVDVPWTIAAGEDMRYPEVEGRRPMGFAWTSKYLEQVHRAATKDPVVLKHLFEVASLVRSPATMVRPDVALRVFLANLSTTPNEATSLQLPAAR